MEDDTPTERGAWQQALEILDQVLDETGEERAAYLNRACTDSDLRSRVEALLAGTDVADFLDVPAVSFAAPVLQTLAADDNPEAGVEVGPYRILREIGRGGMGAVYLAERADSQFQKQVALKLVSGWSTSNERAIRRFIDERQILAALQHPDIAQLFDGGVMPGGLPWFAMEYVAGAPIDRYCADTLLSVERRLELFCRVCGAVQYAHRNLVIHRDLKPANILVTLDGGVKLLDFGIAKLLTSEGDATLTMTGERMMTPMYASPEQIRGEAVSTTSDVYALGVLLCEILTGQYPYRLTTRAPHEVARAILEQEPQRPSALAPPKLARRLRGDLDVIAAKAMQKDPTQRYGSAEQLEADVRRHLAGLPLAARAEGAATRAWKFARRHRLGVAAAATIALLIVTSGVVATVQSIRIRAQAVRIAVERDRAEQVSALLAGLFRSSDPFGGAAQGLTARELLDSGAARIDRELTDQPETRADMLIEIGRAYFGLGMRNRARRFVETSLAVRRRVAPDDHVDLARGHRLLGEILLQQGQLDGAERAFMSALASQREVSETQPSELLETLNGIAAVLRTAGNFRRADSVSREALALANQTGGATLDLARTQEGLAHSEREIGDLANAETHYRSALAIRRRSLGPEHPEVTRNQVFLAATIGDASRLALADSLFRDALAIERRVLGSGHPDVLADEAEYACLLHRHGRTSESEEVYRRVLATARRRLPGVHLLTGTALLGLGELQLDRGRPDRAEGLLREGLAMRRALLPPDHGHIASAEQLLGSATLSRGNYIAAESYLLPSHERLRATYGSTDSRTQTALRRLILLYETSGQPQEAARYRERLTAGRNDPTPVPFSQTFSSSNSRASIASSVAVLPLQVASSDVWLVDLGAWFQDLAAMALTGRSDSPTPGHPTAHALSGAMSRVEQRVSLDVRLADGAGLERGRWRLSGHADSLPQLADALATGVLASVGAEVEGDSAALEATSLSALQAYLLGRESYRDGRQYDAVAHFERAVSLDSTFALASLWLAAVDALTGSAGESARWKFDAAWRQRDRLSAGARALLVAHLGPRYPDASTFPALVEAAEAATRAAPRWAETWFVLSEHLTRWGSLAGYDDWQARQVAALERTHELDPGHVVALDHLTVSAARRGDTAAMRRYANLYFSKRSEGDADFVRWCIALALADSVALRALKAQFGQLPPRDLNRIAVWSEWQGSPTDDGIHAAEILFRRSVGARERRIAANRLVPTLLNRGRADSANRVLSSLENGFGPNIGVGGVREFQIYAYLYWDGDSSLAAQAVERLEQYVRGAKARPGEIGTIKSANCALAHWWMGMGDIDRARNAVAANRRFTIRPTTVATADSPVCESGIEALLAARADSASGRKALARLEAQLLSTSNYRDQLLTIGNLIAASMHEARGNPRRALQFVRHRSGWNVYLSTQLREEGRLAALIGDTATAVAAYRHYVALRMRPESRLKPEVDRVRRELARLEKAQR